MVQILQVINFNDDDAGDPTEAMRSVAEIAAKPYSPLDSHLIEHPAGHLTLKRLILSDQQRIKDEQQGLLYS